jgi:hypothetical protein
MPLFLVQLLMLLERGRAELHRRLGRWVRLLPWLSLAYGLASGIMITRDYEHSSALVRYLVTLVLASILLRWWLSLRGGEAPALARRFGLVRHLWERHALVADFGSGLTQYAVQYIGMFCLPLLFFAEAWWTFLLTLGVVASTLWDDWWERLSRQFAYLALVRAVSGVLAASFAFAVLFPRQLAHFHQTLALTGLAAVLPWHLVPERRLPRRAELAPLAVAGLLVLVQACLDAWLRVPLLSVWLKNPAGGAVVEGRELKEPWAGEVSRTRLSQALARGEEVCCVTPVMSPSGVFARVVHEWRADGRVIDRIVLPEVRGGGGPKGTQAFRTFSCKAHLPPVASMAAIDCVTYLEPGIFLGRVRLKLR